MKKLKIYGYEIRFKLSEEQEETGKHYEEIEKFEKKLNAKLKKQRAKKKKTTR